MQKFTIEILCSGATVLRMFWFMFGEDTFMRAVRSYLEDK